MFSRISRHRNIATWSKQSVRDQSFLCPAENTLFMLVLGLLDATHKEIKDISEKGDRR